MTSLLSPPLGKDEDSVSWMLEVSGVFTVRSSYRNYFKHLPKDEASNQIWKTSAPLKARFTSWLSLKDRLLTSSVLFRRHIAPSFNCCFCGLQLESADRIFLQCQFSLRIWSLTSCNLTTKKLPSNVMDLWTTWRRRWISKRVEDRWDRLVVLTISSIWQEQNARIFKLEVSSAKDVATKISIMAKAWEKSWLKV